MAITATLSRVFALSKDTGFQYKIAAASLDQVATVANEAGTVTDHANRMSFAALVAYTPERWAAVMALGIIVVTPNIQNALTSDNPDTNLAAVADADIKAGVASVWNFYADTAANLTAASKLI